MLSWCRTRTWDSADLGIRKPLPYTDRPSLIAARLSKGKLECAHSVMDIICPVITLIGTTHSVHLVTSSCSRSKLHISGKQVAEVVMVRVEESLAMFAIPAATRLNLARARKELGTDKARLAKERECRVPLSRDPLCLAHLALPFFGGILVP